MFFIASPWLPFQKKLHKKFRYQGNVFKISGGGRPLPENFEKIEIFEKLIFLKNLKSLPWGLNLFKDSARVPSMGFAVVWS